jgi:formylglycine-generating enzyme required for sulfatase activity
MRQNAMRLGGMLLVMLAVLLPTSWASAGSEQYRPIPGLSAEDRLVLATNMVQQGQCRNGMVEITEALKTLRQNETLLRLKGMCETELSQPEARDTILSWLKLASQTHPERVKMLALLAKSQAPSEASDEWALVPVGEFEMGAEGGAADRDEAPKHKVHLDAFYIGKFEVTNRDYSLFVKATGRRAPENDDPKYNLWRGTSMLDGVADLPVINVSWEDAAAYCQWIGGRLPSEAEWEKAARGTDGRTYPWGNDPVTGNRTNYSIENVTFWEGPATLAKVHQYDFGRSPYGAYEMAGNVWEWTQDWYDEGYYKNSSPRNPLGPSDGKERVVRGGGWQSNPTTVRSANRNKHLPTDRRIYLGIRCAKDAKDIKDADGVKQVQGASSMPEAIDTKASR